jgi:hypothetical protein
MAEEQSRHLGQGDPEDDFQPPDLRPLRELANAKNQPTLVLALAWPTAPAVPCLQATLTPRWRAM